MQLTVTVDENGDGIQNEADSTETPDGGGDIPEPDGTDVVTVWWEMPGHPPISAAFCSRSRSTADLDELLVGSSSADKICGFGGDDLLRGLAGNDILKGGAGNDDLRGGSGRDTLLGGGGQDRARGGSGSDLCRAEDERQCER